MTRLIGRFRRDSRGATLAVTAVMLGSVLATIALAFDLGFLLIGRVEAQRAADSGALAGASAFLQYVPAANAVAPARQQAMDYATRNQIRNTPIDTSEVTVTIDIASAQVHVLVRRQQIGLWFARFFGRLVAPVAASATARALPANTDNCIAPLAMPDWWHDANGDTDGDRIWDDTEAWDYGDDVNDRYERFNSDATATETGFGSVRRNGWGVPNPHYYRDQGRDMIIKSQDPQQWSVNTGWFFPIRLPDNRTAGDTLTGASDYRDAFTQCIGGPVTLGDTLAFEMGNMVGPTKQAVTDVIALDPNAQWDPTTNTIINSPYGMDSPRVLTIMLFEPTQIPGMKNGNHQMAPNNLALFFIEGIGLGGNQAPIMGRFLQFASGTQSGPGPNGSLVLQLQLIK